MKRRQFACNEPKGEQAFSGKLGCGNANAFADSACGQGCPRSGKNLAFLSGLNYS